LTDLTKGAAKKGGLFFLFGISEFSLSKLFMERRQRGPQASPTLACWGEEASPALRCRPAARTNLQISAILAIFCGTATPAYA
jgi:hypothetical protein